MCVGGASLGPGSWSSLPTVSSLVCYNCVARVHRCESLIDTTVGRSRWTSTRAHFGLECLHTQLSALIFEFLYFTDGCPCRFTCLLLEDHMARDTAFASCRIDFEAYKFHVKHPTSSTSAMVRRSPFEWTEVREMSHEYDVAGHVTTSMVLAARRLFTHQLTTLATEISIQKAVDTERDTRNGYSSIGTLWRNSTRKQLLSKEFHYNDKSARLYM